MDPTSPGDIRNDEAAFEAFYRSHAGPCRRFLGASHLRLRALYRIPHDDYHEAVNDAMQEAFAIVRHRWPQFDPSKSSLTTWLFSIALRRFHRLLEYWLRYARHHQPMADDTAAADASAPLLLRQAVHDTLSRLHDRQAAMLRLHYAEGRAVREAADMLGVTETAAQSLLQRGRGTFRKLWLEEREPAHG